MEQIKFSVVLTVLNEERTIEALLTSLINQSTQLIEIIIVDAGSTDKTLRLINQFKIKYSFITLFVHTGVNRSKGRNIGIDAAKNNHIAVIDAGCEANKSWLEQLACGFDGQSESVAGFYIPVIKKPLQRLFSFFVATSMEAFDPNTFLPSSRSLAFTKNIWKNVGKYPEELDTCEDLVFAQRLKTSGSMVVQKDAVVYWQQAENLSEFFKQIRGYARGDVDAWYWPHMWKIFSVYARYVVFCIVPPLFLVYLFFPIAKMRSKGIGFGDWGWLSIIQVVSDAGVLSGSLAGLYRRINPVSAR